jgi:hypothetical protein
VSAGLDGSWRGFQRAADLDYKTPRMSPTKPPSAGGDPAVPPPSPFTSPAGDGSSSAEGTSGNHPVVLLGPQRLDPTLVDAVAGLRIDGPLAAITAGWQEREAEVDEMREHVGRDVINLMLHERSDDVFAADSELWDAYRERQDRLKELQGLYRLRLQPAVESARQLLARQGDPAMLDPEREAAIATVRAIDAHHLERLRGLLAEWEERWRPASRPAVTRHRRQILRQLSRCQGVLVAGGHVAVLLNRIRLFDLQSLLAARPVVAWSAGAMVLAEQVVVFHDSPPQGASAAEVLEIGLGLYRGVLPFPHAGRRLRLGDANRVDLLARRFAPRRCVALDPRTRVWMAPGAPVRGLPGTQQMLAGGRLVDLEGEVAA